MKIKAIYLEKEFRNLLFSQAYINSGESLNGIATNLGYVGKGKHGYIRKMWLGETSISSRTISGLSDITNISIEEIKKHLVLKENNLLIEDWYISYEKIKKK